MSKGFPQRSKKSLLYYDLRTPRPFRCERFNFCLWVIKWGIQILKMPKRIKMMNFKHTGVFPEQAVNWDLFKNIIVIDHHNPDQHTIASTYSYIEPNISSAAEIVARLLNCFKVPYTSDVSNYLLAGIELDTNRYKKNTTSITHDVAEKLIDKGASPDFVNRLFLAEFETDCRINNLVYNGSIFERYERSLFQYRQVSFTLNRAFPTTIYKKEDLAKAADKLLEYPVDASFVIGYVKDGLVSISARSKSDINVGEIMEEFAGGGNAQSAACKVETTDIKSLEEALKRVVGTKISPKTESHSLSIIPPQYQKVKK